ncbi:MAG: Smr/MutS family protein [Cytophagaceae bacterium]
MSEIKPGDFVLLDGQETPAQVISIKGNDLEVAMGPMKMKVKKSRVTLTETPEEEEETKSENPMKSAGIDTREKLMHFQFELDVRGKMKDEVIELLTAWVDDALLLGVNEAKVIHGRGSGVLKDTVRQQLRKYKEVESAKDDEGRSGDFVTVVKFKI